MQEVAVEVYPHEKGTEISYLVIVLHFVNGYSVDTELGYKEQGRGETAFETEIDRSFLAVSGMLFVGSTGHNRSLSPHHAGKANRYKPIKIRRNSIS